MSKYRIVGGNPISGTIIPAGNKNSALPIIAASLLTDEEVILTNVPAISDVSVQLRLLRKLGASVKYNRKEGEVIIRVKTLVTHKLDKGDVLKTRGSILFLGSLVGRAKKAEVWSPGGCKLGKRPLDSYFIAMQKLGAKILVSDSYIVDASKLRGSRVWQEETAVTGTENLIMAGVLAKGTTMIINAASEPHVQDLCNFLNQMGARISGVGSNVLSIEGVEKLSGTQFEISSDFMEIGTFIAAAVVTGGEIKIKKALTMHMDQILSQYGKLGVRVLVDKNKDEIIVPPGQNLVVRDYMDGSTNKLETMPWPGFPADLLQFAIVIATQAKGRILVFDKLYEGRLFYTSELNKMGADIFLSDPHRLVVYGPTKLKGKTLKSSDIRSGMSLLIAALAAEGESILENGEIIERGYEHIEERFRELGARIERIV
ncbi:UDP-N-acetylglucosamine 1-carboxyvinyltransferase [Candidatus Dojkabacteria bacterium]|nr:UDP-N-acetylglucosamine 1-carboxyvinyltransferase [Candidatus Dojkabacteria bacterium]